MWLSELYPAVKQRMAEAGYEAEDNDPQMPQALAPPWNPDADVLLAAGPVPSAPSPPPAPAPAPPPPSPPSPSPPRHRRSPAARPAPVGPACSSASGPSSNRLGRTALTVVLALLATGAGGYGLFALIGDSGTCRPALELRVLTDPDLEPAIRAAADAYLTSGANTTDDGCRRSGVTVYSAGAAAVVTALGERTDAWQKPREDDNPQRDIGPQPDVWIPATGADVGRVTAAQEDRVFARLEPDAEPFAYSPVVLAVPRGLARTVEQPTGQSLSELVDALGGAPDAGSAPPRPRVHRLGTAGDHGPVRRRGPGTGAADARAAEQRLARPGRPEPSAARLLCTLPDDDAVDDRSAALVPEFLLKSGVGCHPATRAPRIAAYPDDVPGLEPTFVRVRWEDGDRDAERARRRGEPLPYLADRRERQDGARRARLQVRDRRPRPARRRRRLPTGSPTPSARPGFRRRGADGQGAGALRQRARPRPGPVPARQLRLDGRSVGRVQRRPGHPEADPARAWRGGRVRRVGGARHRRRTHTDLLPFGTHSSAQRPSAPSDEAEVRDAEADPAAALLDALDVHAGARHRRRTAAADRVPHRRRGRQPPDRRQASNDVLDLARGPRACRWRWCP